MADAEGPKTLVEYGVLGTLLAVILGLFTKFLIAVFGDHGARETRLSERIAALESQMDTKLYQVVEAETEIITRCVEALRVTAEALEELRREANDVKHALVSLAEQVEFRPCQLPENHPARLEARRKQLERAEHKPTDAA